VWLCSISAGTKHKLLGKYGLRIIAGENIMLQYKIETTPLATGAPESACLVSLNNGENLANRNQNYQKGC